MTCELSKKKKLSITHYVGSTGNEYSYKDYLNIENVYFPPSVYANKLPLPINEYPYTFRYKEEYYYKCCELCDCEEITKYFPT